MPRYIHDYILYTEIHEKAFSDLFNKDIPLYDIVAIAAIGIYTQLVLEKNAFIYRNKTWNALFFKY